ncbi:MAG TPA: hypothetical protein VFP47_08190 [Pyrinomonadaceae bacterium]|nr:hypothetical protein [Pyrinomonadaceae bacterium]
MGIENVNELIQGEHDNEDVETAIERETQDGPGFESEEELPESDFEEDEQ